MYKYLIRSVIFKEVLNKISIYKHINTFTENLPELKYVQSSVHKIHMIL